MSDHREFDDEVSVAAGYQPSNLGVGRDHEEIIRAPPARIAPNFAVRRNFDHA